MRDVAWPQPTWEFIKEGSPFGSTVMKDEKGNPQTVSLNRATRRRIAATTSTRLERLVMQEEQRDHVTKLLRGTK
jgi:hypothetical protein